MDKDNYIQRVIEAGDDCSAILRKETASTLHNTERVIVLDDGVNGLAAITNKGKDLAVHSTVGHPDYDTWEHTKSMVDRLVADAKLIGAQPIGFTNVIDAEFASEGLARQIGDALRAAANYHGIACLNGEFAVLGDKITRQANVSGTLISELPPGHGWFTGQPFRHHNTNAEYIIVRPKEKYIYANSDGIGTKLEFHARSGVWDGITQDSLAMLLDDTIKKGATALAVSNVLEHQGIEFVGEELYQDPWRWKDKLGIPIAYHFAEARGRLRGHERDAPVFNVSGTVVSEISEERLRNQPVPALGDTLVAVRANRPNPRCNGITDLRRTLERYLGTNWHRTNAGDVFMEYVRAPATVLYPLFKGLLDAGLATSFYHMSGGALEGKLAKPLAKQELHVDISKLFHPDWQATALMGMSGTSVKDAYRKWPMGNDGFFTTDKPQEAIHYAREENWQVLEVGKIERAHGQRIGVTFVAYNGERIHFSGRK